ncbi:PPOX class F420-dependent oxidoreductase [Streptomyces sp. ST2-7A]|uniref:PPOX class F420-dependent oxidoreductase n=1 Tax=Streptomyces sp. ST2-7A TaxID=2907214 RepID=UPI001F37A048|nr:PPOX class F420-dependent oxidoreductase [Streptomyces sp. ST2-7A]MCE7083096.1 PPOX class F420-dependent oxidoreductase [Streptomyces sp. ST2-7A]
MSDTRDPRDEIARLGAGKYLLVTTFRRNGRAVPTPVWVVAGDDALFVWTVADSGKVKRLRNRADVLLAPCDVRGRPTGPAVPGRAELLDAAGSEHSRRLIARRYGLFGRLTLLGSRLRRGRSGTIGVRIVPDPSGVIPEDPARPD